MSTKKSIRLADKTHALCVLSNTSKSVTINWSASINQIAERYDYMLSKALPGLSKGEKMAFCDMYNGHILNDNLDWELKTMDFRVSECIKYQPFEHLLEDISVDDFYKKCKKFTMIEKLAILDMVQKFWNQTNIKQQRLEEMAGQLESIKNIEGLF